MSKMKLKVWWIPQVPMTSFEVEVASIEEGRKICSVLADYDAFQFEHNVKGDYCNAGGIAFQHPAVTEGEWHDVPDDQHEWAEYLTEMSVAESNSEAQPEERT